jgi:hypothetical protein
MKRWWLSWYEPVGKSGDYRPNGEWPIPAEIRAWWCSAEGDNHASLCAVVDASSERVAWLLIGAAWPDRDTERFCEEKPLDWRPGDRFPWPAEDGLV